MIELLRDDGLYMLIGEYPQGPLGGLVLTLILSILSMALVFPLAVLLALARTSGIRMLAWPISTYVNFVRCIPQLLFVFWIYLFVPVLIGFPLTGFTTLVASIAIYQSAYLSEVIRAGILAIAKGQIESAHALGLRWFPITFKIVLPQVLFNVSPGILNVLTIVVKETSLGYMVGVSELSLTASHVNSLTLTKPLEVFAILAFAYFAICYGIGLAVRCLETRVEVQPLTPNKVIVPRISAGN
ncbi:amino acid ABC transporter permease [Mesorhizobium sp. BR1-1-2]|uniref:amino acid ABC transporter permease n=1 Tax=Mesorhizobium sp. BR1-1-2 TaxID=2876652 RepID=UPI001CCC0309|nr:amino acid ABC transporter permease [Mesorhizobium sp. BR1-1-2]MBZ9965866.1 amino acid ABC transporter permease [Mesorhizobium sp. BR1-1-2]